MHTGHRYYSCVISTHLLSPDLPWQQGWKLQPPLSPCSRDRAAGKILPLGSSCAPSSFLPCPGTGVSATGLCSSANPPWGQGCSENDMSDCERKFQICPGSGRKKMSPPACSCPSDTAQRAQTRVCPLLARGCAACRVQVTALPIDGILAGGKKKSKEMLFSPCLNPVYF